MSSYAERSAKRLAKYKEDRARREHAAAEKKRIKREAAEKKQAKYLAKCIAINEKRNININTGNLRETRTVRLRNAKSDRWDRMSVHSEANGRCLYCGIKVELDEMHADHFIPLAKGGSNLRENIVCSCASCNRKKHDKMPEDFIGETL